MRVIRFLSKQLVLMIAFLIVVSVVESQLGLNIVKGDCEGGGPAESFLLIPSTYACSNSGGGSAGAGNEGGGDQGGGGGTESNAGGGDPTNGGSGGGSNQNDSGDEGNNNGGEEGSGPMGGCSLVSVVKTVVGYVYLDANQNSNFDLTLTGPDGRLDSGLENQLIEIYRAAYTVPAHTIPGWEEVTSTDENGNPTGTVWHDPIFVPDEYHPEVVFAQAATDQAGHYSAQVPASSNYRIRHIPGGIDGFTRVSPLTDSVAANISCNFTQSFGVFVPSSTPTQSTPPTPTQSTPPDPTQSTPPTPTQSTPPTTVPSPSATASTPPVFTTRPVVSLFINNLQSGAVPFVQVNQNPTSQASLTWQVSNTPDNSCAAAVYPTDTPVPAAVTAAWNGPKGPPPTSGGPVAIPTSDFGKFIFALTCTNNVGSSTSTLQLNIIQYPPPYFQTTGGGVHTNEGIHISQ